MLYTVWKHHIHLEFW